MTNGRGISFEPVLRRMSLDLPDDKSTSAALTIMPSHQQNTHVFADGCINMNAIFNNVFAVHAICIQGSIFKMSSMSSDQATSPYLSQCWPRSVLPYGITRPQWVNPKTHWSWDNMAAIFQMTFPNGFDWMKVVVSLFKCHLHFFLRVQLTEKLALVTSLYRDQFWPSSVTP